MRAKLIPLAAVAILLLLTVVPASSAQETLTPELLWELPRVGGPVLSPDGTRVVFTVTTYDMGANQGNTDLYLIAVEGGEPLQLTDDEGSESSAQWRPDGAKIGFLSAKSGSRQLWEIDPDGANLRQVSDIENGIANFRYSPTGTHVSFTRDIKLDLTPSEVYADLPEAEARIIDGLMFRHWDSWHDYAYSHLFIAPYDDGDLGDPVDVMPSERFDTPLSPFGGVEQIG
jgi:dipeptidyl aminopeptidase/acylaminoacyl peptidase